MLSALLLEYPACVLALPQGSDPASPLHVSLKVVEVEVRVASTQLPQAHLLQLWKRLVPTTVTEAGAWAIISLASTAVVIATAVTALHLLLTVLVASGQENSPTWLPQAGKSLPNWLPQNGKAAR